MSQIEIVGTSHIAKKSKELIKQKFLTQQPDIIAVELDRGRLDSLLHPQKKTLPPPSLIRKVGVFGYFFAVIGGIVQKKLGSSVGVLPGEDMLYAVQLAQNNHLELALVDRPIHHTLQRLSKYFTFKEKMKLVWDIVKIPFQIVFFALLSKKQKKKYLKKKSRSSFALQDVPEEDVIEQMLVPLQKRYPSLYKVLIHERNVFMMRRLVVLAKKNPDKKILAVVGAGHRKGMLELQEKFFASIEVV